MVIGRELGYLLGWISESGCYQHKLNWDPIKGVPRALQRLKKGLKPKTGPGLW